MRTHSQGPLELVVPSTRRPCCRWGAVIEPFSDDDVGNVVTDDSGAEGASVSHRRERGSSCPPVRRPRGD